MDLIRQLSREEGLTVLFSSHHLNQVQQVCDRVGLFGGGKLLAEVELTDLHKTEHGLDHIYNQYFGEDAAMSNTNHPFWVIVNKEISDYVRSWRFIILIAIIALTCMGSLYTALTNIREAIKPNDPDGAFLFLKLFTVSDGTLPSFAVFISF